MQNQRVTQDQTEDRRKESGTLVFGKENKGERGSGLDKDQPQTRGDCSLLHFTGTSPFSTGPLQLLSGCLLRRRQDLPFHAAGAANIGMPLCNEGFKISSQRLSPLEWLHGGGCQKKAKQIRGRNDDPCVSFLHHIDEPDRQLCVFTQGYPVGAVVSECCSHSGEVIG